MFALTDRILADFIGGKTLQQNGKFRWESNELQQVKAIVRVLRTTTQQDAFLLEADTRGKFCHWMNLAIIDALSPKTVYFAARNYAPIAIPQCEPDTRASGPIAFKVFEIVDYTLVQCKTWPDMPPEDLKNVVPPIVNPNKGIVIDSKGPAWISATVGLAYAPTAPWIACTQLDGVPVVAISRDNRMPVGTELDLENVEEVIQQAMENPLPKRGEIWYFTEEYRGETHKHPCLIMSPDDRNEKCYDVLMVPFTTKDKHAHIHVYIPKTLTGLPNDSYAQCTNLTRLVKERLVKGGPAGFLHDENTMQEILKRIGQALGVAA